MNRKDWEDQVFASNMNPTARMVCIVIGSHGNWTKDQEVRPSVQRIAGMAGMSRETAGKYVEALEEQGWIKHTRTLKSNVKVYELMNQVVECVGILAKPKRGKQFTAEHQPTHQVVESVDNLDDDSETGCRMNGHEVVESVDIRLSNHSSQVVESGDTNLKEPTNEPTIEPTSKSPSPSGPVAFSNEEIKKDERVRFLNYGEVQEFKRLCSSFNVDDSDALLVKRMLERDGTPKGVKSFADGVKALFEQIGIEGVNDEW